MARLFSRERSGITKEALIKFVETNFDELQCGGCANYYEDYGMSVEDMNACELALLRLLTTKHRKTEAVRCIAERIDMAKKGEL